MRILLDTHIFLWFISGDIRLPKLWAEMIVNPENEVYLSVASIWEASIKFHIGKLPLPELPETYLPRQRERHMIESLPIDEQSIVHLGRLPAFHRDPFDRLLVSQALQHDLTIATVDDLFRSYPVKHIADTD